MSSDPIRSESRLLFAQIQLFIFSMRILVALVLGLSLAAHRSSSVIVLLILHVGAYMYLQYLANRMLQLLSGLWLFRTITRLAIIIIQ